MASSRMNAVLSMVPMSGQAMDPPSKRTSERAFLAPNARLLMCDHSPVSFVNWYRESKKGGTYVA